ncbi:MAG: hypothetical protein ACK53Y_07480, partial [bacterium]
ALLDRQSRPQHGSAGRAGRRHRRDPRDRREPARRDQQCDVQPAHGRGRGLRRHLSARRVDRARPEDRRRPRVAAQRAQGRHQRHVAHGGRPALDRGGRSGDGALVDAPLRPYREDA